MPIKINKVDGQFEREALIRPVGFKGGYVSSIWQIAAWLETDEGIHGLGLGSQSLLWSDRRVFTSTTESGGNCLMFAITSYALLWVKGRLFEDPMDLQDQMINEVYDYAKRITGQPQLNKTFVLNALVPVDNAAWIVYARLYNLSNFDEMIPEDYRSALPHRHEKVASIPIASYGMTLEEVRKLFEHDGYQILKFKLGSPGSQQEMLEKDKARIEEIHRAIGDSRVDCTEDEKIPYYYALNGRYEGQVPNSV